MSLCQTASPAPSAPIGRRKPKKAALYVRVSTPDQTVENQVAELERVAEFRGWHIVSRYSDLGISGAKGREQRPGLDAMLKDAVQGRFEVVMCWSLDRLGRSLIDLLQSVEHLHSVGVDLYLMQQHVDTTTPAGKLLFHITGAFAEFERATLGLAALALAPDRGPAQWDNAA
jgi:DNA invertase Pin-like site-specific DNA recombinase